MAAGLDSVCLTAAPWEPLAGGVDQSAGGAGPQRSVAVPVAISSGPREGEGGEEREGRRSSQSSVIKDSVSSFS